MGRHQVPGSAHGRRRRPGARRLPCRGQVARHALAGGAARVRRGGPRDVRSPGPRPRLNGSADRVRPPELDPDGPGAAARDETPRDRRRPVGPRPPREIPRLADRSGVRRPAGDHRAFRAADDRNRGPRQEAAGPLDRHRHELLRRRRRAGLHGAGGVRAARRGGERAGVRHPASLPRLRDRRRRAARPRHRRPGGGGARGAGVGRRAGRIHRDQGDRRQRPCLRLAPAPTVGHRRATAAAGKPRRVSADEPLAGTPLRDPRCRRCCSSCRRH